MKELDVLFEAFFAQQADSLASGGWLEMEGFLEQEDDVLFDWISGRNLPVDPAVLMLINTITNVA